MTLRAHDLTLAGRLAGVSLTLAPGQVTAICGPNGAGKSSLLTCLAGLVPPTGGDVSLDDGALAAIPASDRARAIGYLPQQAHVAWDLSVETLVALGRLPWNRDRSEDASAITAAIAALDLADLRRRPVGQLSGGERARALLARVLAGQPRWLLADEPLANFDLMHQQALLAQFRNLAGQGMGVVLVLHDLAQAMNHADRVVVMHGGKIAADGHPETVLDTAIIARVWQTGARWLGDPGQRALALGPVRAR
ncbi:ABC transporter ATP-binding protein [Novosphingobium sp.]|uniref:ABC transporter ATP-binding protein n=1 Tax=Novosphingobium sp. TaxID=1874826 RepID=UPI0025E81E7F|nr:ABC transporter ATP-binding protein [Novosphingobium sp.]